jgi:two-component sensor histidine kinase
MHSAFAEPDRRLAAQEANHRFLNTLTALNGLLRTDFGGFADPAVREAVGLFSSRILAFATVHRTLSDAAGEGLVDAPAYLARLCAELCAAHLAPRGLHCDFRADTGTLPREACQTLGLIIVELVTNAAKHAFSGRAGGRITVCLRRSAEGWVCVVADNGRGLPDGAGGGQGMTLIRGLAKRLGGELRVHSDGGGLVVALSLPDPAMAPRIEATTVPYPAERA